MMENLEKLIEMADTEFGAIAKNGKFKSREEIHSAYELMDIAKDAYEIWCMEEEMEGGGEEGMSSAGGSYYRDGRGGGGGRGGNRGGGSYYEDGGSYERRGRGRNARRDSMGRYARGGEGGSYRDGGSYYRDGGMMRRGGGGGSYYRDGGKEEFAEELRGLMEEAPDEQSRQSIQQMLQQMGQG